MSKEKEITISLNRILELHNLFNKLSHERHKLLIKNIHCSENVLRSLLQSSDEQLCELRDTIIAEGDNCKLLKKEHDNPLPSM